jgi:nucleoid DNA-binding protein
MSLNKKKMVREIGRRTRLKNRDIQAVIENLIEVWIEELVRGGRIELEGFLTIGIKAKLASQPTQTKANKRRVAIRVSKILKAKINAAL